MKNYIVTLTVVFFFLASCREEEIETVDYSGKYSFESPDIGLEFSFTLIREYGIYKGVSGEVNYPVIGKTKNLVIPYNKAEVGYHLIIISPAATESVSYRIELIDMEFIRTGFQVREIIFWAGEIRNSTPNEPEAILKDQFIKRISK